MAKKKKTESFESRLAETEELVDALESGELPLEESLTKYEKGIANLRTCAKLIAGAEEKVKVLVEQAENEFQLNDLDEDEEDEIE